MAPVKPNIIVIGAGYGGIIAAIKLKDKLGFTNFEASDYKIFEKAADIGGTWRDNTYPGASSDIPIHYYSPSSDLNPNWSATFVEQPEILRYMHEVVAKHDIRPFISFNTKVLDLTWNKEKQHYLVLLEDLQTGRKTTKTAPIVISAVGLFHTPQWPSIPGLEDFQGPVVHTASWDQNVELEGKRIAIIGHGPSACQTIPRLAKIKGTEVTQFIRGKNWVLPTNIQKMGSFSKLIFRYFPVLHLLFRFRTFLECEMNYLKIYRSARLRAWVQKQVLSYMLHNTPTKYHPLITPDSGIGNRRLVFDYGYLESLHRPNVKAVPCDIQRVVEDGVMMKDGQKLPFDLIICATGFITDRFPLPIRGMKSTLRDYELQHDGPAAYYGTLVPTFPNLCLISGPNTATGHTSLLFAYESQMDYIIKLITPVLKGEITSFDVTHIATEAYNRDLQAELNSPSRPFQAATQRIWYRVGGHGRNIAIFPGSALKFWWFLSRVNWYHFNVRGGTRAWTGMKMREQSRRDTKIVLGGLLVLATAYLVYNYV